MSDFRTSGADENAWSRFASVCHLLLLLEQQWERSVASASGGLSALSTTGAVPAFPLLYDLPSVLNPPKPRRILFIGMS